MSRKTVLNRGYQHANHPSPVTRRELLAQGCLSFGTYALMPSVISIFASKAYGEGEPTCKADATVGMIPFLVIDLAGGGNIAGTNVIVGKKGGQMDSLAAGSYATIGLGADKEPKAAGVTLDTSLGLAFHPDSQMLAGIKTAAPTASASGFIDGALFCTASVDDTRSNPHNPLYWIAKAGLGGSLVSLVGNKTGASGGSAAAPADSIDPSKQPSIITKPADALGLVDPGKLATLLGATGSADVQKVMNAIKTMSESKLAMFQQKSVPSQIQDLIKCGYISSANYLSQFTPDALDATKDTDVAKAFPGLATDPAQKAAGAIAKLVLDGYAGGGSVALGGFDYHGQGRAQQDKQDLLAGQAIGRALELAALKKKPLMIYVFTDGGVSAGGGGNGILAFSADSGVRSAAFSLIYNPAGKPEVRNTGRQIGAYTDAGGVDSTAMLTSNNIETLGKAVVANYLALHGKEGDLAKAVGDDPFGADLEKYLVYSKIV